VSPPGPSGRGAALPLYSIRAAASKCGALRRRLASDPTRCVAARAARLVAAEAIGGDALSHRSPSAAFARSAATAIAPLALAAWLACDSGDRPSSGFATPEEPEPAAEEATPQAPVPLATDRAALRERAAGVLAPLPEVAASETNPITDAKVELGRMLYYEPRLSKNQDVSCNTCHPLDRYGADAKKTSSGHEEQVGARNSPTVYNAALHFAQFWDGRAADVEEQAKGPVMNPVEMAMPSEDYVLEVLGSIPGYEPLFAAAFPGEEPAITFDNMARAIAAFERKLLTPSPFDAFLEGDVAALDEEQIEGLELFLDTGCTVCHQGVGIGGGMYQKLGLVRPYPTEDAGRFDVTGNEADRGFFKVPSLRNVAETGPYFHDGSVAELDEAIRIMASVQLGKDLGDEQVETLRAFLGSLTGRLPETLIAKPELPESGPDTPDPDPS
jgi:cytochrome c peroxidase